MGVYRNVLTVKQIGRQLFKDIIPNGAEEDDNTDFPFDRLSLYSVSMSTNDMI